MVHEGETVCPICKGSLKYHDTVKRIVLTTGRKTRWISVRRVQCSKCGAIHRELPQMVYPYKQYEAEVIRGVLEGFITSDTLGYEDYPCEMTMTRWKTQNLHLL